jgi:hypothetical protein
MKGSGFARVEVVGSGGAARNGSGADDFKAESRELRQESGNEIDGARV